MTNITKQIKKNFPIGAIIYGMLFGTFTTIISYLIGIQVRHIAADRFNVNQTNNITITVIMSTAASIISLIITRNIQEILFHYKVPFLKNIFTDLIGITIGCSMIIVFYRYILMI